MKTKIAQELHPRSARQLEEAELIINFDWKAIQARLSPAARLTAAARYETWHCQAFGETMHAHPDDPEYQPQESEASSTSKSSGSRHSGTASHGLKHAHHSDEARSQDSDSDAPNVPSTSSAPQHTGRASRGTKRAHPDDREDQSQEGDANVPSTSSAPQHDHFTRLAARRKLESSLAHRP